MGMSNGDYSISVGATVDTSQAQKTLDQLVNKNNKRDIVFNLDIDTKTAFDKINNDLNNQLGRQVDTTMQRISTKIKTGLKGSFEGQDYSNLIKTVETYKNKIGDVQERTAIFTKTGELLTSTLQTVAYGIKDVTTTTESYIEQVNGVDTKVTMVSKTMTDTSGKIHTVNEETKEWINLSGEVVTQTTKTDENLNQLGATVTKVSNNTQKATKLMKEFAEESRKANMDSALVSTTTKTSKGKVTQFGDTSGKEYKALITTIEQVDAAGKKTIKTIQEFTNSEGQLVQQTRVTDENLKKIAEDEIIVGENAKKGSNGVNSLNWSLADAFKRLANFYLASLPIRMFQTAITDAVQVVKDFDSAITEMGKVTDYSGDKLREYTSDLADLGTEVARTQTEMTEAATGWLKAGYSEEDAALLSKYSALLQNTADEQISAADATSILVSQLKAYHMEAEEAIKVTDIINAVSAQQAVSSADISQGLTVASAAMATFGNSIEQTTALLTAGTTIFQGRSSQVARGLNMIATRVAKNEDELAKYGVSINDANGQLRSTYDILVDLAPAWNNMSKAEQVSLGNTLAGTNQYKILAAIMSQMDVAVETYDQALNSSGETMKQNAVYMDSLEAKTTALKAEFEKLVISKGGLQDVAKSLVNLGTGFLKLVNSIGGLRTILVGLAGALLTIKIESIDKAFTSFGTNIKKVASNVKSFVKEFKQAKSGGYSFGESLKYATSSVQTLQFALGALTTAITVVVAIWSIYKQKQEELNAELEKSRQEYEQYESSLGTTVDKIQDEKTSKQELIQINKNLKGSYDDEKDALIDINDLRAENLKLLYQESQQKANEYVTTHAEEAADAQDYLNNTLKESALLWTKMAELQFATRHISLDETTKALEVVKTNLSDIIQLRPEEAEKRLEEEIKKLNAEEEKNGKLTNEQRILREQYTEVLNTVKTKNQEILTAQEAYTNAQQVAKQTEEEFIKTKVSGIEFDELTKEELDSLIEKYGIEESEIESLMENTEGLNYTREEAIQLLAAEKEAEENYQTTTKELNKAIEDSAKSLGITTTELASLKKKFDSFTLAKFLGELVQIKQEISDTSSVIDNLQGALEAATQAQEEYNENGYLTIDTFQSLVGISAQYLAALVNENGQLEINQTTLGNLVDTLKMAKIEELAEAAAVEIAALQHQESATTANSAQVAVDAAGDAFTRAGDKASKASAGVALFNAELAKATGGTLGDFTGSEKAIIDKYRNLAKQISTLSVNTTAAGNAAKSAGKKGSSAAKSAKDATKELNKELEETKKKYDTVIKWISKQYDKKVDSIKKAKDAATDAIEKEIKALEKEKDTVLDSIEKETDALEKEKDARKKYWDDQIDALKKANNARKDALELQEKLDALEKARNTKVKIYKEGQGFVYDVDQTKVAEAQKALDDYLSEKAYEDELERLEALRDAEMDNYEKRIDALNDYKDKVQKSYEEQIDALNAHREALEAQYDAEIETYQNYKQQFEDMVNAYQEQQDKLLAEQLLGIKLEGDNWMTRLDNLAEFVRKYNELQKQLDTGNTSVSNNASMKSGNTTSSSGNRTNNKSPQTTSNSPRYDDKGFKLNETSSIPYSITHDTSSSNTKKSGITLTPKYDEKGYLLKNWASGSASIPEDGLAIVGENPNQEIVIGSKLNNGELMSLNKGSGVVNAESSSTLAGMLNQVGKFGSSGFGSGNGTLNSNINNDTLTINGVTIQGANIKDPETFVNGLLNLKAEALQRAYKHR